MNFVPITIEIPSEVKEFLGGMVQIDSDVYIAGGFVFDLLNGFPYKDVDLFIPVKSKDIFFKYIRQHGKNIVDITDEYYEKKINGSWVYEFTYKGIRMNAVMTDRGIDELLHFDIRIREMYYSNGQAYASEEALRDRQEKTIRFGSVSCPIRTWHRAIRFKNKYGYKIDERSKTALFDHLHVKNGNAPFYISNYLDKPSSGDSVNELMRTLEPFRTEYRKFNIPFSGIPLSVFAKRNFRNLPKPVMDKLYGEGFTTFETRHTLKENPFYRHLLETEGKLFDLYKEFRLKSTINNVFFDESLDHYSEDKTFIHAVLPMLLEKHREAFPQLFREHRRLNNQLKLVSDRLVSIPIRDDVILTNELIGYNSIPMDMFDGYEDNQVFRLVFSYGSVLYSLQHSKALNLEMDDYLYDMIKDDIPSIVKKAIDTSVVND